MPKFAQITEDELDALFEEGGVTPLTNARRTKIGNEFKQFVEAKPDCVFAEVLKDPRILERLMVEFLNSIRVTDKQTGKEVRPKETYFEFYKSMLKCGLAEITGFNMDDPAVFPLLKKGLNAIKKDIKR